MWNLQVYLRWGEAKVEYGGGESSYHTDEKKFWYNEREEQ